VHKQWEKPVLFLTGGFGDHIMNLPALRALCFLFPKKLRLLCQPGVGEEVLADLVLAETIEADFEPGWGKREFDPQSVAKLVGDCDLFMSLNLWHSEEMSTLLDTLNPAHSIGYDPSFAQCLQWDRHKHITDVMFEMPQVFDQSLVLEDFADPPLISNASLANADGLYRLIPPQIQILIVHADTDRDKQWKVERWRELLDRFLEHHPNFLALILGTRDLGLNQSRHHDRIVNCLETPLNASIAILSKADYFIGIDSSLLHAADFFRIPSVGLFGPSYNRAWGFRLTKHKYVYGEGSMDNVQVDAALQALEYLISVQ